MAPANGQAQRKESKEKEQGKRQAGGKERGVERAKVTKSSAKAGIRPRPRRCKPRGARGLNKYTVQCESRDETATTPLQTKEKAIKDSAAEAETASYEAGGLRNESEHTNEKREPSIKRSCLAPALAG